MGFSLLETWVWNTFEDLKKRLATKLFLEGKPVFELVRLFRERKIVHHWWKREFQRFGDFLRKKSWLQNYFLRDKKETNHRRNFGFFVEEKNGSKKRFEDFKKQFGSEKKPYYLERQARFGITVWEIDFFENNILKWEN